MLNELKGGGGEKKSLCLGKVKFVSQSHQSQETQI